MIIMVNYIISKFDIRNYLFKYFTMLLDNIIYIICENGYGNCLYIMHHIVLHI